ncbi:hypothetical protein [Kribbella deserti]|uniref:DUF2188 domain-containing protein n=1 Tax=Kribbella deserti TaxID=1926257 RepID=A0ABV6QFA1_9ACTN
MDDIETYYEAGVWKCRRAQAAEPFATGADKDEILALGATVARWCGVDHLVVNADGVLIEQNSYRNMGQPPVDPLIDPLHARAAKRRHTSASAHQGARLSSAAGKPTSRR